MKKKLKNTFIIFFIVVLLFGVLELVTRIIFESNTILNINVGGMKKYHPTRRSQLIENYNVGNISINSFGTLGPEFNLKSNPKGVRILTIGDSVAFSPPERNYSKVLEENMERYFPGNDIEVIVAAVPGYSSYESLDWYNESLYQLKPDIAIIYLGWNDMGQYNPFGLKYKNETLSYQKRSVMGYLMENFYFLRIPYFFIGRGEMSKPINMSPLTVKEKTILDAFSPRHYSTNLKVLIEKLKEQGSEVYVLTLAGLITYTPTGEELSRMHFFRGMEKKLELEKAVYNKYEKALEKVSKDTDTPIIDLRKLIQSSHERNIFTDTMHINVNGSKVFGDYIAKSIKAKVSEILTLKHSNTP
jgi:lysophospholipase L1-like esterase